MKHNCNFTDKEKRDFEKQKEAVFGKKKEQPIMNKIKKFKKKITKQLELL